MIKSLKRVGVQFLFLLGLYVLVRLMFLAYNWSSYHNYDSAEILSSLFLGLRFDISSILMMNLPFFLYWLYPSQRDRSLSLKLFFFVNLFFLAGNIADLELIKFNGRRLTPFYFTMIEEVAQHTGQVIYHFWYLTLVFAVLAAALVKFFPKPIRLESKTPLVQILALYVLFLPVWLLGVRGGFQARPVREANAFVFTGPELGNLTLNSSFTFIYARKSSVAEHFNFLTDEQMQPYMKLFRPRPSSLHGKLKGSSVMLIVMESFAREYMGKVNGREGFTPFLDELGEKSLFFKNAYANGRRSIDSIPSLLAGIPALGKEAFLLSGRQSTTILGYPRLLADNGYSTAFYHAAKNGSMYFDVFSERVGMQLYSGLNEYPDELREKNYDGYWGIWDKPYFQFVREEIGKAKSPFFITMFSLSSHQPYDLPEGMEGSFPKGSLEIHPTVAYSDYSLGEFFKSIEKEEWYKNTLFIITADHTSLTDDPAYSNAEGQYRIPILFFHPNFDNWPQGADQKIIKHVDVLPTVFDLLGIQESRQVTGRSVFLDEEPFVVIRVPGSFWYSDQKGFMRMDLEGNLIEGSGDPEREKIFKSYVQYVVNGVNDNSLIVEAPPSEVRR